MVRKVKIFIKPGVVTDALNKYGDVKWKLDHICCEKNKYANHNCRRICPGHQTPASYTIKYTVTNEDFGYL